MPEDADPRRGRTNESLLLIVATLLAFGAVLIAVLAFVLSSQLGGMLQISYENYLLFFRFRHILIFGAFAMVAIAVFLNERHRFVPRFASIGVAVIVVGFAVLARIYLPVISFSTFQHNAQYYPIAEAEDYIDREDREMIVIERDGQAKAYSSRLSFLPHVAGANFGGEDIILAYCVLSSVPIAFADDLGGKRMKLSVLLAPANNLLMYEHNSGEFIRQLKLETEGTETPLQLVPVQVMPWKSLKALYPDAEVFLPLNKNFIQKAMDFAIGDTVDDILEGNELFYRPMYFLDPRLPETERVWGVLVDGEPLAITRGYLEKHRVVDTQLGDRHLAIVYFDEYDTVGAFYHDGSQAIDYDAIDPYGRVDGEALERVEGLFNMVFWGVWAYFYPHTKLLE